MKDINFANCFEGGTEIENLRFNCLFDIKFNPIETYLSYVDSMFSFYKHFRNYKWRHGFAPKRWSYSLVETKNQYCTVPHSWLDNGCVLRLEGSTDTSAAVDLFQEIWSRGQPVVITNATKSFNVSKW